MASSRAARRGLLGVVDHLYGVDGRIVFGGQERHDDLALVIRDDARDLDRDGAIRAARGAENVEVAPHGDPVAEDIEDAAAYAAATRLSGAEPRLGEVERDPIASFRHWNHVGNLSEALAVIEVGIGATGHGVIADDQLSAHRVTIRLPIASLLVGVAVVL